LIAQTELNSRFVRLEVSSRNFLFQLKTAYSHLDDFCKLPEDTKELYLRNSETGNHGYVKPGQERFDGKTIDIRHAYNICTLNLKLPEEVSADRLPSD
jgi:isopenicillin N synthase-like dioxygenase